MIGLDERAISTIACRTFIILRLAIL